MIGQTYGNYRALSLLGEGGMGVVYLAEHPEIGRKVAIKVLHRDFANDGQLLGRFLNEARAANAIRHPNIIEILDSGTLPDRTPYLVMELLEGESLATRLKRSGRLPLRDAVEFTYQTASALSAAHAKGIVHRDLKPDNLFIIPDPHDPARERIKVLDFGIAKLQQPSPGDSVKTRTGTLMGTPIYMSPEQCRGIRAMDHRTDVYSLGVILYEMVVGSPPFMSEGFGDLVNMHINIAPVPPGQVRNDIPEPLDALIVRMLAKAPEDRVQDMAELQTALKVAGQGAFTVRGSSPDFSRTRPAIMSHTRPQTTMTTGVGEQVPYSRPRGKLLVVGVALAAAAAAAVFMLRKPGMRLDGAGTPPVVAAPSVPATPPPPPPVAPQPVAPEPRQVTVVVTSTPAGARVTDTDAGNLLGKTPLTFKRALGGGALNLRLDKDGFVSAGRSLPPLERDTTLDLSLEKKARTPKVRPSAPSEPAKL